MAPHALARLRPLAALLGTLLVAVSVGGLALLAASPPTEAPAVPAPVATPSSPAEAGSTQAASPTPQPLPTPLASQPTQAPAPGGLAPAASAAASSFPVMFDDRFADNRMAWPDDPQASAWFGDGGYRLFAREPKRFVAIGAPLVRPLRDVVLTATFRKVGGPPGGGYGLIVRDQAGPDVRDGKNQGGRYYVLEVGDRGEIGVWRREQDQWVELLPWTPSEAVHPGGEPNEVEVWATGERLTLLVNGVQVASRTDATLPVGNVGIFVGGDLNQVVLDRLVVRAPRDDQRGDQDSAAAQPPAAAPTPPPYLPVTRVLIPSIGLDAPAVPAQLVERQGGLTWDVPPFTIGHAQGTAGAGGPGNAILVGHVTSRSLGNVFEHLHEVRVGQPVQVFSGEQLYDYQVTEVRTVARTDVSVVRPTAAPSVTLITCTGLWLPVVSDYAERLVVRAEQAPGHGS